MKPTPEELKTEIESGPLAASLATPWSQGHDLTVADLLNSLATGRTRLVPRTLSLTELAGDAGFSPQSVAAVFNHSRFSDFRDVINKQDMAGAVAMATLFAATGVIQAGDLTAFTAYATTPVSVACSRAAERGWESVSHLDVGEARKVQ